MTTKESKNPKTDKAIKEQEPSPTALLRVLKTKVNSLLMAEAKLSKAERECQQWQLLFQIKGLGQVIVGKGGVNTTFYTIGKAERVLCLPQDLLNKIDTLIAMSSAVTYSIVSSEGKTIKRGLSKPEAQAYDAPKGSFICEVKDGKRKKTHKRGKGLTGLSWKPLMKA